jgi:alpha-galactosidase
MEQEIGNGRLSAAEERTHMGLWAIAKSPIILGTDLTKIQSSSLATIKNKVRMQLSLCPLVLHVPRKTPQNQTNVKLKRMDQAILAINQDSLGKAATYFRPSGSSAPVSGQLYPYWAGPLSDGVVIGLVAVNGAATLSVNFQDVPGLGAGTYNWTELWTGATGKGSSVSASLGSHDMAVYKVLT